jgi:predicted secreted protein
MICTNLVQISFERIVIESAFLSFTFVLSILYILLDSFRFGNCNVILSTIKRVPLAVTAMNVVLEALGLYDRNRLLGLVFILLVSTIWVIASFLVQGIESAGIHPVVITFVSNSLFSIYFPVYWLGLYLKHRSSTRTDASKEDDKIAPQQSAFRHFRDKLVGNQLFQAAAVVCFNLFLY